MLSLTYVIDQQLFYIRILSMRKTVKLTNARSILGIVAVTLLVACSGSAIKMYSGNTPGKENLSYLDSSGTFKTVMSKTAAVIVKAVDNKLTNMQKSALHPRIELLPGKRVLLVELFRSINTEGSSAYGSTFKEYKVNKTISFEAEAGHYYQIYALLDPEQTFPWFTWIEDKTDGKIVAGEKPGL